MEFGTLPFEDTVEMPLGLLRPDIKDKSLVGAREETPFGVPLLLEF